MKKKLLTLFAAVCMLLDASALEPSGTLPVLHIDTEGNAPILNKTDYVSATYWLETNGVADMGDDLGSEAKPLALQIRGRGNYTWTGFDKKPYRLKLGKKAAMLGMESNKHWALLAHADDTRGFMRNELGFELSRMVGMDWTPGDKPCEVVLNGDYIGLYFLTETVRVDKKRVNVINGDDEVEDWLKENPDKSWTDYPFTPLDNTGGWLVEIDNYEDADQVTVPTIQTNNEWCGGILRITYDTPSDYITEAQKQWLRDSFTEMDRMICDKEDWTGKLDVTAAAKFFVVNQLMGNYESYHGSCKLFRQRGEDEKWIFGPVWDFGSSLWSDATMQRWIWVSDHYQHWIEDMYSNETFKTEVRRVYEELMETKFNDIYTYADRFATLIKDAAARDYERWPQYGNRDEMAALSAVKQLLALSAEFCNKNLGYKPATDYNSINLYLRGQLNGWNAESQYRFTYTGHDAIFTLVVPSLWGEFKIAGSDWTDYDRGYGVKDTETPAFPIDIATELTPQGNNIHVDNTISDATLILDYAAGTLTISTHGYDSATEIEAATEAPVYYNLQGTRVDHPSQGLHIVVRGNTIGKE